MSAPPLQAGAQGAFSSAIRAPHLARSSDREEAAVSAFGDQATPGNPPLFAAHWTLSTWDVWISTWDKGKVNPRGSMVVDTAGWTSDGSTLYAHYYRGTKLIKNVRIGALTGPCGDLHKRVRQFPFRPVRRGTWKVYFSVTPILDKVHDDWIWAKARVR